MLIGIYWWNHWQHAVTIDETFTIYRSNKVYNRVLWSLCVFVFFLIIIIISFYLCIYLFIHLNVQAERLRKEEADAHRKAEDEAKKKIALSNMGSGYSGILQRVNFKWLCFASWYEFVIAPKCNYEFDHAFQAEQKRGKKMTEREKKKKIMADRVKPLSVDNLSDDKLRWNINKSWRCKLIACKLLLGELVQKWKFTESNHHWCKLLCHCLTTVQGDSARAVAGAFQPGGDQIWPLWEAQKTKIWGLCGGKRVTSATKI